jgi:hypothetical protein
VRTGVCASHMVLRTRLPHAYKASARGLRGVRGTYAQGLCQLTWCQRYLRTRLAPVYAGSEVLTYKACAKFPGEARKLVPDAYRDRNDNVVVGFVRSGAQTTSAELTEKEKRLYALIELLTRLFPNVGFGRGVGKKPRADGVPYTSGRKPHQAKEAVLNNKARVAPGAKLPAREPSGPHPAGVPLALRVWREWIRTPRPETEGCPSNRPSRKRLPQFNPYAARR